MNSKPLTATTTSKLTYFDCAGEQLTYRGQVSYIKFLVCLIAPTDLASSTVQSGCYGRYTCNLRREVQISLPCLSMQISLIAED